MISGLCDYNFSPLQLWLVPGIWVNQPTLQHLESLSAFGSKFLFLLDDLDHKIYVDIKRSNAALSASKIPFFPPRTKSLQTRLLCTLQIYERYFDRVKVIATARNDKYRRQPESHHKQPSAKDKLQKNKHPQFWNRFTVYELPKPEDESIARLLRETIPDTGISATEENYLPIARQNDCTFENVVANLARLRNRELPLTPNNYRDTLEGNWDERYQDAVKRYPMAVHIYDAVDLLQQLGNLLSKAIGEASARREAIPLWERIASKSKKRQLSQSDNHVNCI
ncbi:MAG: hypothetical protein ACRC1Z_24815 [Waterburya sp.]